MKRLTADELMEFNTSYRAEDSVRCERLFEGRSEWNALDVLAILDLSALDKLEVVLQAGFLLPLLLHEFGRQCVEWALSRVKNPDPRCSMGSGV